MGTVANVSEYYTWGNASVPWNNAGKTWSQFGQTTFQQVETEEIDVSIHTGSYAWKNAPSTWKNANATWPKYGYSYPADTMTSRITKLTKEAPVSCREVKSSGAMHTFAATISVSEARKTELAQAVQEKILFVRFATWGGATISWMAADLPWKGFGMAADVDFLRNRITKPFAESPVSLNDWHGNQAGHTAIEPVSVTDKRTMELAQKLAEQVQAVCLYGGHFSTTYKESAGIKDKRLPAYLLHVAKDPVKLADKQEHRASFHRMTAEQIKAADMLANHYTDNIAEAARLRDAFPKILCGALSDIGIKNEATTLKDFEALVNRPLGYEPFIPYLVGEYEYQKALVRLTVVPGSLNAEPAIYDAVIHVDIDDTVERGESAITDTAKATTIRLTKHFYTKPEITVSLRAGNTKDGAVTPNITVIDKDKDGYYFGVELVKADSTLATGRISWMAVGY